MRLFNFIKKSRAAELEAPPPPPMIEGEGTLPPFPELPTINSPSSAGKVSSSEKLPFSQSKKLPSFKPFALRKVTATMPEELPPFQSTELPSFEPITEQKTTPTMPEQLPLFPGELENELEIIEQKIPIRVPTLKPQQPLKPLEILLPRKPSSLVLEGEEIEREAVKDEHKLVHAREKLVVVKPLFIEGMRFRKIIGSLSEIHTMLEENEEHQGHWTLKEDTKDTHLEHFKTALEHMQRKLIYIDKALFE